jgi:3-methylcrotonyl-CoA carboxylase alpha subunit
VVGPANNLEFLRRLAGQAEFAAGAVDTGFIARHLDALVADGAPASGQALAAAALHLLAEEEALSCRRSHGSGDPSSPWGLVDGWRLNGAAHQDFLFLDETGAERRVRLDFHRDGLRLELDGHVHPAAFIREDGAMAITLAGERFRARVIGSGTTLSVIRRGLTERLLFRDPLAPPASAASAGAKVIAPMPGRVVAILVSEGAHVAKGAALIALEAMKMEHTLTAPFAAVVASIRCAVDEIVSEGTELVTFESEAEPAKEAAS